MFIKENMETAQPEKIVEAGKYKILAKSYQDLALASFLRNKQPINKGDFVLYSEKKNGKREDLGEYSGLKAIQTRIFNKYKKNYLVLCLVDFKRPEDFGYGLLKLLEPHINLNKNFIFFGKGKKTIFEGYNVEGNWNLLITSGMLEEFVLSDGPATFFEGLKNKSKVYFIDIKPDQFKQI